ncbi:23S rRNA (cytidine-2'-O)-methyltransferase TlyA [Nitrosophilus kaiyonis]|uniref:23S rRNA (cytidine-2'-O)-methyltransferase TlyA n=1 Tax=Nitrosophilus kaiyonis TaxID=2930200 RepID=UPI0024913414|nr:TlyA family RNA methyltransferase [Nitrosophilus kaiyonis]
MRLDRYLFEKKLAQSRNKAKELIEEGCVKVNKKSIKKPSFEVDENDLIEVENENFYVSRAAKKLENFLKEIDLDIKDKEILDIGASTGGFTQILLNKGAKKIYALDVGKSQLHESLRNSEKIINIENQDIREYFVDKKFDIVTCDVSFISVIKIIKDIDRLSKDNIIILFKPQFEVGKDVKRDKKGVVKDKKAIEKAIKKFEEETKKFGWKLIKKSESKIAGKEGNQEFFYYFKKVKNG